MQTHAFSRQSLLKNLRDLVILAIAMLIGSIGWIVFLLPNNITMGGLAGIASVVFWGTGLPVQYTYLTLNVILLAAALMVLGWRFCLKTIVSVLLFTLFVSILSRWTADVHLLKDQPFMAAVLGACFLGSSVGLGLSVGGSTGGSDIVAAMVNKYRDVSLGHVILICDLVVITSSYWVLHDWELVLYGYVVLFISSFCVDQVVNSMRRSVQFFIISDKHEEIGRQVNSVVNRGCTVINAQGFYSGKDVKMLFVLARQSQSAMIFSTIDAIDPNAFVSQSAVIGVYGQGFDRFKVRKKHAAPGKPVGQTAGVARQ